MSDWKHVNFGSAQGTQFQIDFQTERFTDNSNKPNSGVTAKNAWANVQRPDLDASDKVRMVVTSTEHFVGNSNSGYQKRVNQHTDIIDLNYAEKGRFTAPMPQMYLKGDGYSGSTYVTQKIALVVNGEWQDDPMNGTHDFQAELAKA